MDINRREFVAISAAAVAAASMPGNLIADTEGTKIIPWHQKIRRAGQVNATEHDPARSRCIGCPRSECDHAGDSCRSSEEAPSADRSRPHDSPSSLLGRYARCKLSTTALSQTPAGRQLQQCLRSGDGTVSQTPPLPHPNGQTQQRSDYTNASPV